MNEFEGPIELARSLKQKGVSLSTAIRALNKEFDLLERETFRFGLWAYCSASDTVPTDWLPLNWRHAEVSISGIELGMSEAEVTRVLGTPMQRTPRSSAQEVRWLEYDDSVWIRFICGHSVWSTGGQLNFNGEEMLRIGSPCQVLPPELGQAEVSELWTNNPEVGRSRLYFSIYDVIIDQASDGLIESIAQGDRLLTLSKEPGIKRDELLGLIESELAEINDPAVVKEIREHLIEPYSELREWDYDQRDDPKADHEYWVVLKLPNPKFAIAYTRDAFGGGAFPFPWGLVPLVADGCDQDSLWSSTLEETWKRFGPR